MIRDRIEAIACPAPSTARSEMRSSAIASSGPIGMMLDADHQEVGDWHWLARQTFTDLRYATGYCAWVQSGGKMPLPDFPDGAV
jgi:hypothetical protein